MTFRLHARLVYFNLVLIAVLVVLLSDKSLRTIAIVVAAAAGLTVLAGYFLKVRVIRPLREVSSSVQRMANGDTSRHIPAEGDEEIASMAVGLNSIAQRLNTTLKDLTEGKQRVESLVEAMGESAMVLDSRRRITLTNQALLTMIGTARDIVGKTPLDVFRNPQLDECVREALSEKGPKVIEIEVNTGRILETHVSGVPNLTGVVDSVLIVFHDLTEARRTERMRRDFVANVSHEFKTPLTAIRGYQSGWWQ